MEMILRDHRGQRVRCDNPLETTASLIKQGYIIGIKGVGGYHLCCLGQDQGVIQKLRIRKKRAHKPFAIMARDIASVEKICHVSSKEKEVLQGLEKPIVLLKKKTSSPSRDKTILPEIIAPGGSKLGVMLPYTPIHHELFTWDLGYLIMTSANISGLPICYKDQDAQNQLKDVVDYYLIHNKEILLPMDDSVVRVIGDEVMISRAGRGYAPYELPLEATHDMLALGAEQKSAICITKGGKAYISQFLGDIKDCEAYTTYTHVMGHMMAYLGAAPKTYIHDLNPDYLPTQYGKKQVGNHLAVQHHHAHMASCMGEHGLKGKVIGVIFDGTGLGTDETVWGGEFLVGGRESFERAGHLECVTLQGGDKAISQPWRSALCFLQAIGIDSQGLLEEVDPNTLYVIKQALGQGVNCFVSSSMGRLFDCVAALTGLRQEITYDAQGAMELESQIDEHVIDYYVYEIHEGDNIVLGYQKLLMALIGDIKKGLPVSTIAAKFHNSIINATVECVQKIREKTGLNQVVLSGGVFENTYLLRNIYSSLQESGFEPYCNQRIPINDAGIAYGQSVVGCEWIKEGNYVSSSSGNHY